MMKRIMLIVSLIMVVVPVVAQGLGPGLPGDDPDVPIDGGMYVLMAAGILYGIRSIKKSR
jgi:hypothetical protein